MKRSLALVVAAFAAACASYSGANLRPGSATAQDVVRTMGRPAVEIAQPDGGRELIYPHGPLGTQTYIAHLDRRGTLQGVEQVLDNDHFRAIQPGQAREDVMRLIGPPGETMQFAYGRYAWQYRFIDAWGYLSEFSVTFDRNGVVIDKVAIRVERNESNDR